MSDVTGDNASESSYEAVIKEGSTQTTVDASSETTQLESAKENLTTASSSSSSSPILPPSTITTPTPTPTVPPPSTTTPSSASPSQGKPTLTSTEADGILPVPIASMKVEVKRLEIVDTLEALHSLAKRLEKEPVAGIDCEGEKLSRTGRLCLLQVALPTNLPDPSTSFSSSPSSSSSPPFASASTSSSSPSSLDSSSEYGVGDDLHRSTTSTTSVMNAMNNSHGPTNETDSTLSSFSTSSSPPSSIPSSLTSSSTNTEKGDDDHLSSSSASTSESSGDQKEKGSSASSLSSSSSSSSTSTSTSTMTTEAKVDIFLVDVVKLGAEMFKKHLKSFFEGNTLKVMHDCRMDSDALFHQFGIVLQNVFDLQCAFAILKRQMWERNPKYRPSRPFVEPFPVSFAKLLQLYCNVMHTSKNTIRTAMNEDTTFWSQRPLTEAMQEYAASDVRYLLVLNSLLGGQLQPYYHPMVATRSSEYCDQIRSSPDGVQGLGFQPSGFYKRQPHPSTPTSPSSSITPLPSTAVSSPVSTPGILPSPQPTTHYPPSILHARSAPFHPQKQQQQPISLPQHPTSTHYPPLAPSMAPYSPPPPPPATTYFTPAQPPILYRPVVTTAGTGGGATENGNYNYALLTTPMPYAAALHQPPPPHYYVPTQTATPTRGGGGGGRRGKGRGGGD